MMFPAPSVFKFEKDHGEVLGKAAHVLPVTCRSWIYHAKADSSSCSIDCSHIVRTKRVFFLPTQKVLQHWCVVVCAFSILTVQCPSGLPHQKRVAVAAASDTS